MFNSDIIKKDFPLLNQKPQERKQNIYLDSTATSQKPQQVLDAIVDYYHHNNANVHRGVHYLSDRSTTLWEKSRATIANFFGAQEKELIITRNTTEALNGVAYGWADHNLKPGDVILSTVIEHHSNLVVWQETCRRTKAKLEVVRLTSEGELDLADMAAKLKIFPVKLVALTHVSNALGTITPLDQVVSLVKKTAKINSSSIRICVDGAQSAPHFPVNFSKLGVDFFAFSGHKMLGPMGVGGLLVRRQLLESTEMKPWFFGGGMVNEVAQQTTSYTEDVVNRFTPGTPDVASVVGLAAACQYLTKLGMENVAHHDKLLVTYALKRLGELDKIEIIGPLLTQKLLEEFDAHDPKTKLIENRIGSVAFLYQGVHAHDVAQVLDSQGIAVRSGHHCTMPLHTVRGWAATVRASFSVYNSLADIDALVDGLIKVKQVIK